MTNILTVTFLKNVTWIKNKVHADRLKDKNTRSIQITFLGSLQFV